jgi:CDP-diacylglycerol pyrophosphatase
VTLSLIRFYYINLFKVVALALLLVGVSVVVFQNSANVDRLWQIVNGHCVPDMQRGQNPAPCDSVELPTGGQAGGFAILKDAEGETQYLLIPIEKIEGIESSRLLVPGETNYFSEAWAATDYIDHQLHHQLPRTDFALAINSVSGRTQNQLHIHIDCIRPEVKLQLQKFEPRGEATWQDLPMKLAGQKYRAMWLTGTDLGAQNPFIILADSLSNPLQEMGSHTLVLTGAEHNGKAGFILLDGEAPTFAIVLSPWIKLGLGSGEELEDHLCRVAKPT